MGRRFWRNLDRFTGWGCIFVLFSLLIVLANLQIKDLDLWLHLKTGQYILENRAIPYQDIFSFTIAGKPWINHEWLFQLIAYLAYHFAGPEGVIKMQVVVVTITFLILFLMGFNVRKRNYLSVALPLLFVLLVYRSRFTVRPDIFSLLFFAFYLYVLHRHIDKPWIIFALPLSQILWANFHGFFFLGILLIFIMIAAEYIKRTVPLPWKWNSAGRLTNQEYKRLILVFFLTVLASLANPYTLSGFLYPFKVMVQLAGKSKIFFMYIQELKPALTLKTIFLDEGTLYYKGLILLSLVSFLLNYRNIEIGRFLIWLTFLISSAVAIRNIAYFSFAAYFVYLFNQRFIFPLRFFSLRFQNISMKYITSMVFKLAFIFWVIFTLNKVSKDGYYDFNQYTSKSILGGISSRDYPSGGAEFILDNDIRGNIFNDFNSGAYLIGRCFPQIRVYIDGRTEMYGPDFFEHYRKVLAEDARTFNQIAERYDIKAVFLSGVYHPISGALLKHLYESKLWKMVYFDSNSVVFLKVNPENKDLIDKFAIDLSGWTPPELDAKKIGTTAVYPFPNINRAYVLESLNLDDGVIKESQAALKIMPNCGSAFRFLGKVYYGQNLMEEAFENLRLAAMYLPGDADLRINLSAIYQKFGDIDNAIKQLKQAVKINPQSASSYYHLALLYAQQNNIPKLRDALSKAIKLKPPAISNLLPVARGLYQKRHFVEAVQVYQQAVKADAGSAEAHAGLGACYIELQKLKAAEAELAQAINLDNELAAAYNYLGILYAKQGKGEKAQRCWKRAIRLDPGDKEIRENIKKFIKEGSAAFNK